jgi:hypothetical protein
MNSWLFLIGSSFSQACFQSDFHFSGVICLGCDKTGKTEFGRVGWNIRASVSILRVSGELWICAARTIHAVISIIPIPFHLAFQNL